MKLTHGYDSLNVHTDSSGSRRKYQDCQLHQGLTRLGEGFIIQMDGLIYHHRMCTLDLVVHGNPAEHAQVHGSANGHKSSKAVWRHYMKPI